MTGMDTNARLVEALRERQGDQSQVEFAAALGVSQTLISLLYSGEYRIGRSAAGKILARYPELRNLVADVLLAEVAA